MTQRQARNRAIVRGLAAWWGAAALLVACGGGGGDEAVDGGTPSGSASSAYAQGPIEGFGSIIVGGVRFDDSSASVEDDDGSRRSRGELRLGQTVQVEAAGFNRAAGTATAARVRLGIEIVGPVSSVSQVAGTLVVMGQVVEVGTATVFDDSLAGGLAALTPGTVVEVHGLPDSATGHLVATRIEAKAAATEYRLRGVVAALDTSRRTLRIGSETISYAEIPAAQLPAGLADGVGVRVRVKTTQVAGAWVATALRTPARPSPDAAEARVQGVITVFASAASFEINGLKVDASGAAFPGGSAGLALGVRVEVQGTMSNGVLVARQVSVEGRHGGLPRGFELRGTVGALDTANLTFVVRNVTVSYAGSVEFRDGTAADLANGRRVEVKGVLTVDRSRLQATRIELR